MPRVVLPHWTILFLLPILIGCWTPPPGRDWRVEMKPTVPGWRPELSRKTARQYAWIDDQVRIELWAYKGTPPGVTLRLFPLAPPGVEVSFADADHPEQPLGRYEPWEPGEALPMEEFLDVTHYFAHGKRYAKGQILRVAHGGALLLDPAWLAERLGGRVNLDVKVSGPRGTVICLAHFVVAEFEDE